ncbi:MAG TPA: hypothetical protein VH478_14665 [Trebonia sp.]|nr:hypothetical protein [Trebonia sp.]
MLFAAAGGTDERFSVWAYTVLAEAERDRLSPVRVDSIDELPGLLDRAFAGREAVLALADDLRIRDWSPVQVDSGLLDTASDFLDQILKVLEHRRAPEARLQARLAEVEAVAEELIKA